MSEAGKREISMQPVLKVSDNGRFLVHEDGRPFFYLGDTAWELFHRLNREEADFYLSTRAEQGFTDIQAVVLAEHEFERPNAYGHLPLADNDPARPDEAYFEHVDFIVNRAQELGLWVGMLPTWGDKWNQKWGAGPEIFTSENAFSFGEYLGRRYADRQIIWILGGDRPVESEMHRSIIRSMADGLAKGDGVRHLRTFHPQGQQTSSSPFHSERWLDFNMYQTGHARDRDSYNLIAADYALHPVKPCMDAEPGYEDHPNNFKPENGYLDASDVRKSAYWGLFAGGHGHTYGCHDIWQFHGLDWKPITSPRTPWREALQLPGANQMRHLRSLLESRPFLTRIPDQSLLLSDPGKGGDHAQATRDKDGSWAFVYLPSGLPVIIDLSRLTGENFRVHWFDPRSGEAHGAGECSAGSSAEFSPPGSGEDWILTLDDAARQFSPPGIRR